MTFPELDPVLHAPVRLRMACLLAAAPPGDALTFGRLQELLTLSPGNLSTHLRKMEDADFVGVTKAFRDRTPVTSVSLTPHGHDALRTYTEAMAAHLDGSIAATLLVDTPEAS